MTLYVDPPADDAEAKEVLATAYENVIGPLNEGPDTFALGFAQAVGLKEGSYGKWGPSNRSNNWGAITRAPNADGSCPADSFSHKDSSADGEYTTCFRIYDTSLKGAEGFLNELFIKRPAVLAAARNATYPEAIRSMYASSYFLGLAPHDQKDENGEFTNVNEYIKFVAGGIDQIAPLYPIGEAPSEGVGAGTMVAIAAAGLVGIIAIANR
jgi:hypothetical protein